MEYNDQPKRRVVPCWTERMAKNTSGVGEVGGVEEEVARGLLPARHHAAPWAMCASRLTKRKRLTESKTMGYQEHEMLGTACGHAMG